MLVTIQNCSFLLANGAPVPAACVGQCVLQRYVWYGCCRLLAVMSSLRARYHTKLLFSPCKRCPCPCSDAVHSPSSSGLRGFVPVVLRDRWEQGRFGGPGARGLGAPGGGGYGGRGGGGGGGSPGPESIYTHTRTLHFCIIQCQDGYHGVRSSELPWVAFASAAKTHCRNPSGFSVCREFISDIVVLRLGSA